MSQKWSMITIGAQAHW